VVDNLDGGGQSKRFCKQQSKLYGIPVYEMTKISCKIYKKISCIDILLKKFLEIRDVTILKALED
jgi:hypothetical protein